MRTVFLLFTNIMTLLHGSFVSSLPHCEASLAWKSGALQQQTMQWIAQGQHATHIAMLELDALIRPQTAAAFDALADAYEKNGDPTTAIHHYRHVLRIEPDHRHARERLRALANRAR